MRLALSVVSVGVGVLLSSYLALLVVRTGCFRRTAAVGSDVVVMLAIASAVGFVSAWYGRRFDVANGKMSQLVFLHNSAVTIIYLVLTMIGKLGPVRLAGE